MLKLIFNRWVAGLLGIVALGLLIWYGGPLIAIAEFHPLDQPIVRLALIVVIALWFIARATWRFLQARMANAHLSAALARPEPAVVQAGDPAADQEVAKLQRRFEEAVGILKRSVDARPGVRGWLPGRQYLYDLPWYVFIGAPGSGKTTALVNSGIRFPLAERLGQEKIKGVGGTRNCDWWFSDEAIFLDTAGRYTTQESDQEVDRKAWTGFLDLLKKYRPRRPINGVVVTVSVADLLEQSQAQIEELGTALRARVQELHERLGIRFPVYVMVTKADLLAGFMEFFGEYGRDERAQVWGVSFPIADKTAAPMPGLNEELEVLEQRLNDRLVDRLQQERDVARRALIYAFPQQFSAFRRMLAEFLAQVFDPSAYETQPMVRGVYLTSGTQEGSPIDRIMGQLSRTFGLEQRVLPPARASGKAYFITRLIKDVMFAESGIAGTNLRWERRRVALQWGVVTLATLLGVGIVALWLVSYARNKAYVADVDANLQAVSKQVGELRARPNPDVVGLLPLLHQVKGLADTADVAVENAPLSMGFGLYQGRKLGAAATAAYRRVLQDAFLPRIQARMEQQLRARGSQNPEYLYEGLKAYIMLGDDQHFDGDALKSFITTDWETTLPRDVTVDQRKELSSHLDALFAQGYLPSPVPQDAQLVASARDVLARTPIPQRIYNRLRRQGVGNDLPEFTLVRAVGPAAQLVFERKSQEPLNKGVAGLYSYDGYYKSFIPAAELVTTQFASEEDWVLGVPPNERGRLADVGARLRLSTEVRRMFLEDYARKWEEFVNDIRIVRPANLTQSINVARILSAPDTPLPVLLNAIVKEVTLVRTDPADKGVIEKTTDVINKKKDDLRKILGQQAPAVLAPSGPRLESIVDDRFENLRRLTRSLAPGQPPPIDATVALIGQLYALLTANEVALRNASAPPPSDLPIRIKSEAGQLPEPLQSMLLNLSQTAANQALTASRDNISKALPTGIGNFCDQAIAGRYPFSRNSSRDVTQDDFARLFGPTGIMEEFFQKNLLAQVDTSSHPWKFRQVGDTTVGTSSAALLQFERAQTIRDVFFRSGRAPGFRIDFKPIEMDATILQFTLDVDGQLVKYSHEPPQRTPVQWPAPNGGGQVRLELSPTIPGKTSAQTFDGPWALFRLLDRMRIEPTGQPERFLVTFNLDGRSARFELTTNSVQNPFRLAELDQFICPDKL